MFDATKNHGYVEMWTPEGEVLFDREALRQMLLRRLKKVGAEFIRAWSHTRGQAATSRGLVARLRERIESKEFITELAEWTEARDSIGATAWGNLSALVARSPDEEAWIIVDRYLKLDFLDHLEANSLQRQAWLDQK